MMRGCFWWRGVGFKKATNGLGIEVGDVEYVARLANQAMFSFIRHNFRSLDDYLCKLMCILGIDTL